MNKAKSGALIAMIALILVSTVSPATGALTEAELNEALVQLRIDNAQVTLNAEEALQLIEFANDTGLPFSSGGVALRVTNMHQGQNSNSAQIDSASWLEIKVTFQDGIETFRTNDIRSTFVAFEAFRNTALFSFQPDFDPLRTIIRVDIIPVTNHSQIGSNFCFDFPRNTLNESFTVNGIAINADLTTSTGIIGFDESTQEYRGSGVSFVPELAERLLGFEGITLNSGDIIGWEVTNNNRFTVWTGFLDSQPNSQGEFTCNITGEFAFDVYATGMLFNVQFTFLDPLDQITVNTALVDSDGDGVPDVNDDCDFTRETINGFQDFDGCPDVAPPPILTVTNTDTDGDGFANDVDDCPTQPETINGFQDFDGCPDLTPIDTDGDGIPDSIDQCPLSKENFNGIEDEDGCEDGSAIQSIFTPFGEPLVNLTPEQDSLPVQFSSTQDLLERFLVESEPETNIHLDPETDITGESGDTQTCDNLTENCIVIIAQAVQAFEQSTGLQIPFALTTINIIIFFALITFGVIILLKVFKKI